MREMTGMRTIVTWIMGALMWLGASTEADAQRITTNTQVIDCGQVLFRKPVTVHFELTNEGEGTCTIKKVDTSCGCTEVSYPKGIITENKPFVVTATYDAKTMGHFEKYIDLYTNGATLPFTLVLRGVVVDKIKDFGGNYPFTLGKLKADANEVVFDDVAKGEYPTAEIHVLNSTSEMVSPAILHLPEYLKADVSPSSIPPGEQGVVIFTLDSRKTDEGLYRANVYLGQSANDKASAGKEIKVTAIRVPSFGVVTDQQLVYMPKLKLQESTLELGSFEGKKKKKGTIVVENLGRTNLEISKVQSFTEGITTDITEAVVAPGQALKIKVNADRKLLRDVEEQPKLLLISNDPRAAKVIIDINIK